MNRKLSLAGAIVAGALLAAPSAQAEVLTLTATQAVVLPASDVAPARVALQFDLSGLATGEGRRIDSAVLDWSLSCVSSEATSLFAVYAATAAWTSTAVGSGAAVSIDEAPAAEWDITPLDHERNGGGFVRFDLTELVRQWAEGERSNHGVLIATPDLSETTLGNGLAAPRLVVRYGFLR
jgi:hypothetical protein